MKKIAIATLAFVIASAGAGAIACEGGNGAHKGHKDPEQRLEHLSKKLDLTPAQRDQAKQIFDAERSKRDAAHDESKAALAKVLSQEQLAKFEEMGQRCPRGEEDMPPPDAP